MGNIKSKKRKRECYGQFYNTVFSTYKSTPDKVQHLLETALLCVLQKPSQYHLLRFVNTFVTTQSIGQKFERTFKLQIEDLERFMRIRRYFAARKIQEHAIRRIWRPTGVLIRNSKLVMAAMFTDWHMSGSLNSVRDSLLTF